MKKLNLFYLCILVLGTSYVQDGEEDYTTQGDAVPFNNVLGNVIPNPPGNCDAIFRLTDDVNDEVGAV